MGKALVDFARERGIPIGEVPSVEIHKGLGVTGIVAGRSMLVGGRRLADNLAILIDARTELVARRWESEGKTVSFFGWDGGLKGAWRSEIQRGGTLRHLSQSSSGGE